MERVVMLVDDEANILTSLARLLRRDGYTILCCNSGKEGLAKLQESTVNVIISDQRMPEMTGTEFLSKVKELYPETVRIVLSGYTDLKSITDAINQGAIYKFLTKPWDDELLRTAVREAFDHAELKQENRRLTQELLDANSQLQEINTSLKLRAEQKSHDALFSMTALQVSQDVLDHLPVAVLGVSKDGMVVVANQLAQQWLNAGLLIGQRVQEVAPTEIAEVFQRAINGGSGSALQNIVVLPSPGRCTVQCVPLGQTTKSRGWVIMISSAPVSV